MDDDLARLAREERLLEAAELAASRGNARDASELFERACAWSRAAEEAATAGEHTRAFLLAVLGKEDALAERLVLRVAASSSAAEAAHAVLERRGEAAWDARLLEAAGRPLEAARAWERAGDPLRAALLLERGGDVIGAARLLSRRVSWLGATPAPTLSSHSAISWLGTERRKRPLERCRGSLRARPSDAAP